MKAMIFAAGLGTRMKPYTDTMPKALVPVCGKPLLWHVIHKLKHAGVTEIVINVHHFASMIEDYLAEESNFGINISISDERDLLRETGGGIKHAGKYLCPELCCSKHILDTSGFTGGCCTENVSAAVSNAECGSFLVHNADIISDLDIKWFESSVKPQALATLLVSERETSRYLLFDDDMRLVGWTNVSTGEVRSPFPDLDPVLYRKLAFSGIHIISNAVFPVFESEGFGDKFPIMDFYLNVAGKYPIYGVCADTLHLADVGKPDSISLAESILSDLNASAKISK